MQSGIKCSQLDFIKALALILKNSSKILLNFISIGYVSIGNEYLFSF